MTKLILILIVTVSPSVMGGDWIPSEAFLRAVSTVESSDGRFLYGDNGRSLGRFQMSEAAWLDVNEWRQERRLKTYVYRRNVMNSFVSRVYAANYFSVLHSELDRNLRRPPTFAELYAAYNLGLSSFAECGFEIRRVNSVTRRKCKFIEDMAGS